MNRRDVAVVGATVVAGLTGTLVALGGRNADVEFLADQRNPPDLRPAEVERVVRTAPDPLIGTGEGESARCVRTGRTPIGNPWRCTIAYGSGREARIVVRVEADGSYRGRYAGGGGASGCCIELPGAR